MYCLTKKRMKFGGYDIPERTRAEVVNNPQSRQANIHGLQLRIAISLWEMAEKKAEGVLVSSLTINNEEENISCGRTESQMVGIVVSTNAKEVYLDAGDKFYQDAALTPWEVKKIFGEDIPECIEKVEYTKDYLLPSVIDFLDTEFAEWVQKNCHFRRLTKKDIENGGLFDGASPGDRILSETGIEQFSSKQREYQNRLEAIGFTYDFKGGLIWE